jgi:1-deoxy-D-xylulose-5-phosphate synthase
MGELLQSLTEPADLKNMTTPQLEALAAEIRQFLLETVAQTGGHLAPNLGVVELTLALHSVFDSPRDQIIWDVGHQSYIHKIITGRLNRFETLRQYNGLSGFPKPEESEHDVFATGHSSTSISAALGLAKARDIVGENNKVVAVIGDGSMTGGMAFEALNHLGHLQTDLIIVLNDNEMSISKNVGALSRYLTRLRLNPRLRKLKYDIRDFVKKLPKIGHATLHYLEKLEASLTFLVIPGMFFEELGIKYLGPIDGHNIAELKLSLQNAHDRKGPVLIHVLTTKGKGYELAEQNPQKFHGTGPFLLTSGQKLPEPDFYHESNPFNEAYSFSGCTPLSGYNLQSGQSPLSYTEIFGATIVDLARKNDRIIAITAAMTDGTGLWEFSKTFPERFFDVGIAEEHAVTMAAGLAKKGLQPVVVLYSTFMQRAYDQIVHDVCLQNLPVVFMVDRAGLVGPDGPTHHGAFDFSFLRHIPNLTIMAPGDEYEFRQMIYTAFQTKGPVVVRYPKRAALKMKEFITYEPLPMGKGEILLQGQNTAIIAAGAMVIPALQAASRLQKSGLNVTVVNGRFVKPLDEELLLNIARTHQQIITVEENATAGGFGSAVVEFLIQRGVKGIDFKIMGIPDEFITHGPTEVLLKKCGLDVDGICRAVRELNLPVVGMRVRV